MEIYRDVAETFPDWLKGHKRVVAVLGVDGVVIVHWASDKDIFQFATAQKSLGEIANEYAGGISFDLPQGSKVGMEIAKPTLHQGTDTSGPLVWSSPWDRVELSSDTSAIKWNAQSGRLEARNTVLTFVTGHLLELDKAKAPEILMKLDAAISEFNELLKKDPPEEEVQQYLTKNPVLLSQDAVSIKPKVELGSEHITDFVIERAEQEYIMVEIERPGHELFTKQGDPRAAVTHAQRQVEDWLDWVSDNKDYAQRHVLSGVSEPKAWVIIGRRNRMDKKSKKALARKNRELNRIEIMTFDDLASRANNYRNNLQRI